MAEVAADTLPENMVQAVIGRGALGQALAEHSGFDAVGFTGSVAVGKRVAIAAAGHSGGWASGRSIVGTWCKEPCSS